MGTQNTYLKYFFAWFGMMMLAVINGGFRDVAYKQWAGDLAAHQISTVTLIVLITIYLMYLTNKWRIVSPKQAWTIGGMWFIMTEMFEFGMGRIIQNEPWDRLLHAYNLLAGQMWIFIPLYVLIAPYLFYRLSKTPA